MALGVCDRCRVTIGYARRALPNDCCPHCQQPLQVLAPPPPVREALAVPQVMELRRVEKRPSMVPLAMALAHSPAATRLDTRA
jgi:hypothetical protein